MRKETGSTIDNYLIKKSMEARDFGREKVTLNQAYIREKEIRETFKNEVSKSVEMDSLVLTLQKQEWGSVQVLQETMLSKIKRMSFNHRNISTWASSVIQKLIAHNEVDRKELGQMDKEILKEITGLGLAVVESSSGSAAKGPQNSGLITNLQAKRLALTILEG